MLHFVGEKFGTAVDWIVGLVLELLEELRGIVTEARPTDVDRPSATKPEDPDRNHL